MTTTLEIRKMEGRNLDTIAMADLYPELRFVWDMIDDLREEREDLINTLYREGLVWNV